MLIKTILPEEATGRLADIYKRVAGPDGRIDNILSAHSLRPHTLEGHMALYKAVLHHSGNNLPKSLLETIGVYVSLLNGCGYCVAHHFEGLRRLLADDAQSNAILDALKQQGINNPVFTEREQAALAYAERLTERANAITEDDIGALRAAGFDDGEILEINQVTAYFAYANRTVLGLGVMTDGETLGLSPRNSEDSADWGHR